MKLFKPWASVLISVLGLLACACAQTQTPPAPYQRAGTYPAELQMMRRLIEIAEGPPPTIAALEAEFGLTYQKNQNYAESSQIHIATGQFPFNPGYASYYSYTPKGKIPLRYEISFKFMTKDQLHDTGRQFCVSREDLITQLIKRKWERRLTIWQPHSIAEETYLTTLNSVDRRIFFLPQLVECVGTIAIDFTDPPLISPTDSSTPSTPTPGNQK